MAESGALRELLALFQLDVNSEELEKGTKKVEGFVNKLKAIAPVIAEAFAVKFIKDFVQEEIEAAAHIQDMADKLDVSASSLKEFGIVAQSSGVDFDAAANSLGHLSKNLGEAQVKGGDSAAAFQKLHVRIRDAHGAARPLMDVVEDVAEGLSRLPNQQQRATYAMQIFGREGRALLPVLAQDKEKLKEMLEEAHKLSGGIGDEYYADAKKAREETEHFGVVLGALRSKLTLLLLPTIIKFAEKIVKLGVAFLDFTKKSYILQTALIFLAGILGYKFVGTIGTVLKALGLLGPTIASTVGKLLLFLKPLAIITFLYIVFDDLYTLMKGGQSVIGDTVDALFGLGSGAMLGLFLNATVVDGIRLFKDLAKILIDVVLVAVNATADGIVALAKALDDVAHGRFKEAGKDITDGFADIPNLIKKIEDAGKDVGDAYEHGAAARIQGLLAAGVDPASLLNQINRAGGKNITEGTGKLTVRNGKVLPVRQPTSFEFPNRVRQPTSFEFPNRPQAVAGVRQPTSFEFPNKPPVINQTNTTNVEVHTSSNDPKAIGEAVGQGVATTQEKANNNAILNLVRQ